jgi:hypothetical protein
MKNLFNDISNDERQRILEMHQNATKRNYLNEQPVPSIGNTSNEDTITRIKTSEDDLNRFLVLDQNYINSLFPNLVVQTKSDWDSVKYPLQQALTWYAKSGRNPSTNVLSSVVNNIGGNFPESYQMMIKGNPYASSKGKITSPKELDEKMIIIYNHQLTKV